jgi:hypothetical protein
MNQPETGPGRSDEEQARRGAEGAMGDGGDPAGASEGDASPALRRELTQGGLGQALAGATGQPGLAEADQESKTEAGAETPAKE